MAEVEPVPSRDVTVTNKLEFIDFTFQCVENGYLLLSWLLYLHPPYCACVYAAVECMKQTRGNPTHSFMMVRRSNTPYTILATEEDVSGCTYHHVTQALYVDDPSLRPTKLL